MAQTAKTTPQVHNIEPVYDAHSKILILGSFSLGQIQGSPVFLRPPAESFLEGAGPGVRSSGAPDH